MGGGPAGLYFSIAAKLRDAGHEITVIERDPPEATYGWGVVYWNDLLDILHRTDPESARAVSAGSVLWQDQEIRLHGSRHDGTAYFGGYGYSMGRAALLEVLTRRARSLGVDVRHGQKLDDPADLPEADLIVAADGAGSRIRQSRVEHFGTRVETGRNPYIWLGTDRQFGSFVFDFEETPAGWIWFHAYPSIKGRISTCIVECAPQTWQGLGFDTLDTEEAVPLLEKIFHRALDGRSLISRSRGEPAKWQRFGHISNRTWVDGNVVLAGDAAHTTHFTLGSGTRLAIIDAIVLAHALSRYPDLRALHEYDQHRRAELHSTQAGARSSMAWFEQLDDYLDRDPVSFAYAMSVRTGQQRAWKYQVHLATQLAAVRSARRAYDTGKRWYRDRRRGEAALPLLGSAAKLPPPQP
ncbi:FAD-dependent monooxygenase [Streptomyces roseochromogenus]|uniref:FAD-dependent monooxygenase n=1 Tax=Streptomyces roseochromogenus TaxID=285450 RepID=UPI001ADFB99E|nr:FAD-dependent monooxygenase [Streptomyces roseochromogenus]